MSRLELERFTADFERDRALAEEFTRLGDDAAAWLRLAADRGYRLTAEEAQGLSSSHRELSDDELENVAGGDWSQGGGGGTTGGTGTGGG
jgi:predicted ribosomally synthesized peptide with nif11-like leader